MSADNQNLKLSGKVSTKVSSAALVFFVLMNMVGAPCPAQTATDKDTVSTIKVRLVSGKTGKPIKSSVLNLWFGDETHPRTPRTNSDGEVMVEVNTSQFQDLRIMPSVHADCRFKGDSSSGMQVKYSLDEILTKGVVSKNLCGSPQGVPAPKVLVLFVRPRSFVEKWRL